MSILIDLNTGEVIRSELPALALAELCHGARYNRPWHEELITVTDDHVGVRDLVATDNVGGRTALALTRYAECVRHHKEVSHV